MAIQAWVKSSGAKVCVVFEGRDTAGKGGTIKRKSAGESAGVPRRGLAHANRAGEVADVRPAVFRAPPCLGELPHDREIHVICRSGQRAYYATRLLVQNGFDARVISGGILSHANFSAK